MERDRDRPESRWLSCGNSACGAETVRADEHLGPRAASESGAQVRRVAVGVVSRCRGAEGRRAQRGCGRPSRLPSGAAAWGGRTSYVPRPQKKAAVRNEETTEADPITPSKDWATKGKLVTLTEACAEAHFPGSSTSEGSHLASIFDKKPVLGSFRESALLFWPDGSPAGACDELELVPADLHGPKNQLCFDHDLGGTTARLCLHHGREPTIEETMQEAIEREKHGEGRAP